jgi:hypothetical protein
MLIKKRLKALIKTIKTANFNVAVTNLEVC